MQHQPYPHIERLAELRHADLIAAGAKRRNAAACPARRADATGEAASLRRRARRRIVIAGAMTAAVLTTGTAYAVIAAPEQPGPSEPADSLVVNRSLRAI